LFDSQNDFGVTAWEYSKNPHQQIYDIRRVNVQTREVEVVTGGNVLLLTPRRRVVDS
jgi:hypothetical protein